MTVSRRDALFSATAAAMAAGPAAAAAAATPSSTADAATDTPLRQAWARWQAADKAVRIADESRLRVMDALGGTALARHFSGDRVNPNLAAADTRCQAARAARAEAAAQIDALPAAGTTGALIKLAVWAGGQGYDLSDGGKTAGPPAEAAALLNRLEG